MNFLSIKKAVLWHHLKTVYLLTTNSTLFQIAVETDDNPSKIQNELALQIRRIIIRLYTFTTMKYQNLGVQMNFLSTKKAALRYYPKTASLLKTNDAN